MKSCRSLLSVPADNWRMIEKAVTLSADMVMIDLEDAVAASAKAAGRVNVVRALRDLQWGSAGRAFRVNAVQTPHFYRDLIEVVEQAGNRLELVVVPKINSAEDHYVVSTLLTQIEAATGLQSGRILIGAQIETAQGLVQVEHIAAGSRLQALHFGPGDFAATVGMPVTSIGVDDRHDREYPGHRMHYAMARILVAARAAGIEAIDGPYADYKDLEGFRRSCMLARGLGYSGKWCIHPGQIPIANDVFSPTAEELAWAAKVIAAYQAATDAGSGAISVDQRMIDAASLRMAQALQRKAGSA